MRARQLKDRTRFSQTDDGGLFPPVQIRTTGDPISVIDGAIGAIVLGITLAAITEVSGAGFL